MSKKSGVYRHHLFRRGEINSIARIRPRTNGPKKKMSHQNENDDKSEVTNYSTVVNPFLGNSDDEGIECVSDMAFSRNKAVTIPIVSNDFAERPESVLKGNCANETDKNCIKDIIDGTPVGGGISSTGEDLFPHLTDQRKFNPPYDNNETAVSPGQSHRFHAMVQKDFSSPCSSGANSQIFRQAGSICTIARRGFDFDLFDNLDEIQLCSCNGSGCYFEKYIHGGVRETMKTHIL